MIVIRELDASLLRRFPGAVERFSGVLPAVAFFALRNINPRAHDERLPDRVGGFECLRPLFLNRVVRNVFRRRSKLVAVENGADFLRRLGEVARELEFFVANLRNLRDGALEILLHEVAHGVELQTDAFNVMSFSRPRRARGGYGSGDRGSDKSSSSHGANCTPFAESWQSKKQAKSEQHEPIQFRHS